MEDERHVLTIEDFPVIRNVLNALAVEGNYESSVSARTRERLREFAIQGCDALILNLRVVKESLYGTPPMIKGASFVGGVLVVACVVTSPWILRIEELRHRHSFPKHPISSFGTFVRALF